MNILVIGLGSMGKRRIRLIQEMFPTYKISGVDAQEERRNEATELFGINCFESIEKAKKNLEIDSTFVCTSPLSHSAIIKDCLTNKWNVFTELNLVKDGYKENIELAQRNDRVLFLSSTFFYREEIRYIQSKVTSFSKWNYIYHIGQYLPDWHPWENYNNFFVGNKKTNGCREIMAIEFPWLVKTFGTVKNMNVLADKMTELKIDYNDNYMIQLEHENGNKGTIIIDIVSPVAVRELEIYAENKYIQWNGTPDSLCEYDRIEDKLIPVKLEETEEHKEGYRAFVVENAYKNEIKEFFNVISKNIKPIYGFEEDLKILQLIDQVEAHS